jgi:ABC-type transport system substrate-binding protein
MKKLLMVSAILILIVGTVLGSCGEPTPEETTTPTTAPPTTAPPTTAPPTTAPPTTAPPTTAPPTSWDLSEDGKTWTFHIRQGLKFHNGDPLTSADVLFSVEHFQSPDSTNPWSMYLVYNFDSHYCPDDYTYVYKTVDPEPPLIMLFASTRVIPKNYIETNGIDYFREHPIGSGPWKFVSFTSGDNCIMEANTEHWRTVPHFQRLEQYVVPEEATQVAMLKRGDVDIITGITLDRAISLGDEGWTMRQAVVPTGSNVIMPGTWMTDGPTSDIRVRRALAYSINRQEIADTFFHGYAEPGGRFFHYPGMYGWDPAWLPEPYDPDLAASLLEEAGYPDAFDNPVITIYIQVGTGYTPDLFQILQGYWTEVGIQTEIVNVDPFEMLGMFFVPHFDDPSAPSVGAIIPWVYGDNWPTNVYHSKNMYCPGGVHTTSNDEHALELYLKAVHEPNPELGEQYYKEFSAYVHDELFINFGICLSYDQLVVGPGVGEFGWGEWMNIADAYADIHHAE